MNGLAMDPGMRWIDDVVGALTAIAIGALVSAGISGLPRAKQMWIFGLMAGAGVVYLSYKHQRDALEG